MSYHRQYKVRDYQFGFQALQLREKAGLTQTEVAASLKVSERAIQHWEGGSSRPTAANLRKLIALYLTHNAFMPNQEYTEAKLFWEQGCISTPHSYITFDDDWFITLLTSQRQDANQQTAPQQTEARSNLLQLPRTLLPTSSDSDTALEQATRTSQTLSPLPTLDWDEATDVSTFYGREQELATLEQWILTDQCRLAILLGMGGIGKTILSVKIARQVATQFDFVLWRSLRNAPPFEEIITDCIQFISGRQYTQRHQSNAKSISVLIDLLRKERCLLVFDNIDTLLQEGDLQGHYRPGYEDYSILIQRIAEIKHCSCLLLTSREMLNNLGVLDGKDSPVRTLKVAGLGQTASQDMLKDKELFGEPEAWSVLVKRYGGNPLALKIVAETVRELFGGDIAAFLQEGQIIVQDILLLLNHQFERLSALEQDLMYWLAIERDPVSLEELNANFIHPPSKGDLLEALKSLRQRCLIERLSPGAIFTLQPVVLEYITERLVEHVTQEISTDRSMLLTKYALMKGQAKEYLRNSQMRLLLQPTLQRLIAHFGSDSQLEQRLLSLATQLRTTPYALQGYGGGNLVNLLANLKGHIRGIDFSHLIIRQAYLQGIEAQDTNFAEADLTNSVFMETFDSIAAIALSRDSKYLAMGSFNGQVCIWQVADGKPLLALKGHARMVWSVAFSHDSTLLASGSDDRTVKLWEVKSGRCIKTLKGHTEWVRAIHFHPNGKLLATSGDDETIRIWNIQQGNCLRILHGHTDSIWSIAFHPNGQILASGSYDKTVRLWDVASGACIGTLHTYAEEIVSVAFSCDGTLIASGGEGGMRIWDTKSQHLLRTLPVETLPDSTCWIWSIAFTPEGTLVSGGDNESVIVWDVNSGQCLRTLQDHSNLNGRIWSIDVASNNLLASGSHDGIVKLWDINTGHCLRILHGYNQVICTLAFSPNGSILVNGDDQGTIRMWEVSSGRPLQELHGHNGRAWSLAFSPDGTMFVSGGNDRSLKLWNTLNGQCLKTWQEHAGVIWAIAFSPDGSIIASGSLDRTIKLWKPLEPNNEDSFKTLQGDTWIWSLAFSPNGTILASGSADGAVQLWNVASGACLTTLRSGSSPIGSLVFSPDGKTLASCSNDEMVWIWDVESGNCLKTIRGVGNANWVKSVSFSHDGTLLATGSNDTTIKIWNMEEEHAEITLIGHKGSIWSIAFNPAGTILASGGDDGIILLWSTQTGDLYHKLRSDRPFERMNISGAIGITQAQRAALEILGAVETPTEIDTEAIY